MIAPKASNPITQWDNQKGGFSSLHLYAFDTLATPAMSAEYERVFSSTKKLITPERSQLAEDIIEVSECLKNWWGDGLIQQPGMTRRLATAGEARRPDSVFYTASSTY